MWWRMVLVPDEPLSGRARWYVGKAREGSADYRVLSCRNTANLRL